MYSRQLIRVTIIINYDIPTDETAMFSGLSDGSYYIDVAGTEVASLIKL